MNPGQIAGAARADGHCRRAEWEPYAGLGGNAAEAAALVENSRIAGRSAAAVGRCAGSRRSPPAGEEQSTQAAFGKILLDLAKRAVRSPIASSRPRRT
jgi:pyruvate dehydrogenase E1 component